MPRARALLLGGADPRRPPPRSPRSNSGFEASFAKWQLQLAVTLLMCVYLAFTTLPLYSLVVQMHTTAKKKSLMRCAARPLKKGPCRSGSSPVACAARRGSSCPSCPSCKEAHKVLTGPPRPAAQVRQARPRQRGLRQQRLARL